MQETIDYNTQRLLGESSRDFLPFAFSQRSYWHNFPIDGFLKTRILDFHYEKDIGKIIGFVFGPRSSNIPFNLLNPSGSLSLVSTCKDDRHRLYLIPRDRHLFEDMPEDITQTLEASIAEFNKVYWFDLGLYVA